MTEPTRRSMLRDLLDLAQTIVNTQAQHSQILATLTAQDTQQLNQEIDMAKQLSDYVADLQGRLDTLTADVTAQTTVIGSVKTLLEGEAAQIAALKQQVQDLLDAGGDPATLQPVIDALDAQHVALVAHTQTLVDAVVTGTV